MFLTSVFFLDNCKPAWSRAFKELIWWKSVAWGAMSWLTWTSYWDVPCVKWSVKQTGVPFLNCQTLFLPLPFSPQTISQENKEILPLDIRPHTVPKDKVLKSVQVRFDLITEIWHIIMLTRLFACMPCRVFTEMEQVLNNLHHPRFTFTETEEEADILWTFSHIRDYRWTHTLSTCTQNTIPSFNHTDARWESAQHIKPCQTPAFLFQNWYCSLLQLMWGFY